MIKKFRGTLLPSDPDILAETEEVGYTKKLYDVSGSDVQYVISLKN